jgi:hypothetical protein
LDEFIEKLAAVFEKVSEEDMFRPLDPYHMALALDGIINNFLFRAIKDPAQFRKNDNLSIAEEFFPENCEPISIRFKQEYIM